MSMILQDMFVAGTDTSHTALEWAMAELLRHPNIMKRKKRCPGTQFAMTIIELVIANIVFQFDWALPNGETGEALDLSEMAGLAVHKKLHLIGVPSPDNS